MAIFDIIEDVSKKQVEKTDTGDSRVMGLMLGQVVKNYDDNMPGKVCIILLSRETTQGEGDKANASRMLWARVVNPSGGSSWGHYFIPEVGDLVVVAFEQGNIERAYIIGCIPKTNDKIITKSKDKNNRYKKIVTKYGNSIIFEDVTEEQQEGEAGGAGAGGGVQGGGEEPGSKDKITIKTSLDQHKIFIDNEKKLIEITDKEKNNYVRLNTAEDKSHIEIKAAKKLTVTVGDNISLVMNGESGAVTLKAKKVSIQTDDAMTVESSNRAEFKGSNVTIEGSSMVKLESNGSTSIGGTPIKIG